jgi:hypothetical protein
METLNEIIVEQQCVKCGNNKCIDKFRQYNSTSHSNTCKKCLNDMDKIRKKIQRQKKIENCLAKCEKCNNEKTLNNFAKLKKFYKKKICLDCYPQFLKEQKTEWCKNEHNTNMNYRIKKSLAARLRNVLNKTDTTMNYIGCNIQYFREWIEYNFTEEMNWDNYASLWSIDHIIPVCKFDLTIENEKLNCWNWSNMMPVTIKYNSSKKSIDIEQINYIIQKIEKFKEEGSTTKWFSSEFILNMELVLLKNKTNALNADIKSF